MTRQTPRVIRGALQHRLLPATLHLLVLLALLPACAPQETSAVIRGTRSAAGTWVEVEPAGDQALLSLLGWERGDDRKEVATWSGWEGHHASWTRSSEGVSEWWRQRYSGLEFGYDLRDRLAGEGPLRLVVGVEGAEALVDRRTKEALLVLDSGGLRAVSGLTVLDASQEELAAWFEADSDGLAIVVDDRAALYPLHIDPLVTSPTWAQESDQAWSHFGSSVGVAGDVDGDGYGELIVGNKFWANGETREGRALLYSGSATGVSASPTWAFEPDVALASFGTAVASGDWNGDGYEDCGCQTPTGRKPRTVLASVGPVQREISLGCLTPSSSSRGSRSCLGCLGHRRSGPWISEAAPPWLRGSGSPRCGLGC